MTAVLQPEIFTEPVVAMDNLKKFKEIIFQISFDILTFATLWFRGVA